MLKQTQKKFLFLPVLVFIGFSSQESHGDQKLTVNNQTDYYITVTDLQVGYDYPYYSVKSENPPKLANLKPWQEGIFENFPDKKLGLTNEMYTRSANIEIRPSPDKSVITNLWVYLKDWTATSRSAYVTKDQSGIETRTTFTVKVTPTNFREFDTGSSQHRTRRAFTDFVVTITQSKSIIAPEGGLVNPGTQVLDTDVDYKDVLVSLNNESDYDLSVTLGQHSAISLGKGESISNINLKDPTNLISLRIKLPEGIDEAKFTQEKNTISKFIRTVLSSQDVVERLGKPAYLVQLNVTPRYSKEPSQKLWRVKYNIEIKVDELK